MVTNARHKRSEVQNCAIEVEKNHLKVTLEGKLFKLT